MWDFACRAPRDLVESPPCLHASKPSPRFPSKNFSKPTSEKRSAWTLHGERLGFDRPISEPAMNRPGLALAGFFSYFARKRVQVLGNSELSYLKKLPEAMHASTASAMDVREPRHSVHRGGAGLGSRRKPGRRGQGTRDSRFRHVAGDDEFPQRGHHPAGARIRPERHLARLHGGHARRRRASSSGRSGSGKSWRTAIGLLERGASLVADDMVRIKYVGGDLVATAPDLSRGYMEIRGIGIINVANLYGLASIRPDKRLDLVVTLKPPGRSQRSGPRGACFAKNSTKSSASMSSTWKSIPSAPAASDTARIGDHRRARPTQL